LVSDTRASPIFNEFLPFGNPVIAAFTRGMPVFIGLEDRPTDFVKMVLRWVIRTRRWIEKKGKYL